MDFSKKKSTLGYFISASLFVIDNILEMNHPVYTSFRVKGSIGKPKIIQVWFKG